MALLCPMLLFIAFFLVGLVQSWGRGCCVQTIGQWPSALPILGSHAVHFLLVYHV